MILPLLLLSGGLGFLFLHSQQKRPPTAAPPVTSAGGAPGSGQPGIQSQLNQVLQKLNIPGLQTSNQAPYGGSKGFMGQPATPVSTQVANAAANVNWGGVATGVSSLWSNLSSSNAPATDADPTSNLMPDGDGNYYDPSVVDMSDEMNGPDTVDASSAFDSAPDMGSVDDFSQMDS